MEVNRDIPSIVSPHRLGQSTVRAVVYAALLTAVLYLLYFNVEPGAPFRRGGHPPAALAHAESQVAMLDPQMHQAAGNGNLQLHFAGHRPDLRDPLAVLLTEMYYSWNYQQYPRRVFVGDNDRIINGPSDMFAADALPEKARLRAKSIGNILTLVSVPGPALEPVITPVR